MPNIKSAAKRAKTSEKNRIKNKGIMTLISSLRNDLYDAISAGDSTKSLELFKQYYSVIDKAAKKGIIRKTAASRRKSRASLRMATLK
ncbi:MAG: 30S ribosomal protein S20 [Kiritimatiellae bacterium]|nr:30S ribosomal protein S20 [Kiritimatiellia bacterium]MDD5519628.1 30S ribosomal protein S20 [Kiritimatiellia bacterium]